MDEQSLQVIAPIVVMLALVAVNAFFVVAEFSLVAARRGRIDQLAGEGSRPARRLQAALDDPNRAVTAAQLGISMASLALGWLAGPTVARWLEPLFAGLPGLWPWLSAYAVAAVIAFALITLLHVALGELVPKALAIQRAEAAALFVATPLTLFGRFFGPVITLADAIARAVARLLGLPPTGAHELVHTEEELRLLVTASQEGGVLEATEEEMLHKVFAFADKEAHQVMVPRTEVAAVPAEMSLREFVDHIAREHVHTRFPVYEGSLDSIVGIIHLKDAVLAMATGRLDQPVRSVMRPVLVVPESIHIDDLLRQLRRRRMHMAALVDEYGGTAGIVTMEDLLEEIVGEIRDEFDVEEPGLADRHDGTYSIDGLLTIDEFNERFGQSIEEPAYDTIAGYVFGQLGRVAQVGDEVAIDGLLLRVEAMDGLRIASLRVLPAPGKTLTVDDDDLADDLPAPEPEPASSRTGTGG
jgi:CBS domain containing-hemolysin-like protein